MITKKEKSSLKISLFHLVFTDVNTSFVHAVNSPLFLEQQKRYEADLSANKALNLAKVYKSFEPKFTSNAGFAGKISPNQP